MRRGCFFSRTRCALRRPLIVKGLAQKILGVKSPTITRKIDEMHAKYGDACWDHLDELDKSARLFYGEVQAKALREEIDKVLAVHRH